MGMAAAVVVEGGAHGLELGVTDSKRLNEKQREWVYEQLTANPHVHWSVGEVDERRIEEVSILQATHEAMNEAVRTLLAWCRISKVQLMIDGNRRPPQLSGDEFCCTAIVGGDRRVFAIAAASIIAKVVRDRHMRSLQAHHPAFAFSKHKGYGTKQHLLELKTHGYVDAHRRS